MSPAEGIQAILKARASFLGPQKWGLRVSDLGTADNVVAVIDSGGRGAEVGVGINYPSVQVLGRGDASALSYPTLYRVMEEVFNLLQAVPTPEPLYPELTSCMVVGGITPMGRDDSKRPLMSLNFQLITTPADPGYREQN